MIPKNPGFEVKSYPLFLVDASTEAGEESFSIASAIG